METDNKQQGSSETKNGSAVDDKSKSVCVSEPDRVTAGQVTTERGGSAIDDRSKDFEVFDDPKA